MYFYKLSVHASTSVEGGPGLVYAHNATPTHVALSFLATLVTPLATKAALMPIVKL